jgi:hypothetical protein
MSNNRKMIFADCPMAQLHCLHDLCEYWSDEIGCIHPSLFKLKPETLMFGTLGSNTSWDSIN